MAFSDFIEACWVIFLMIGMGGIMMFGLGVIMKMFWYGFNLF